MKIHYFPLPGRGEVSRLILAIGNIPFEDVHYTRDTFAEFKPKTPLGQVPVLELDDGTMIAQSGAIERYCAKLAGLYPEDPLQAALADQAAFQVMDFLDLFGPTGSLPLEERIKARQELLAGKAKDKLNALCKIIEAGQAKGGYIAGDKLSFADVVVFNYTSFMVSGFYDGIPTDLLNEYPVLKAFRNKIANEPAIKAYYEKHGEGLRAAYKPDA